MRYYIINLRGSVAETNSIYQHIPFLEKGSDLALDYFYVLVNKLIRRKQIKRVLIRVHTNFKAYPGQLEEIYHYLEKLASSGKELYFYAKSYDLKTLYLASVCQHRVIAPDGTVAHYGLALKSIYLKNFLDQLGINADIYRRGKYKGAADTFRVSRMDEAQKEVNTLLLKRISENMEHSILKNKNSSDELFEDLKSGVFYDADAAVAKGLLTLSEFDYNLTKSWQGDKWKKAKIKIKRLSAGRGKKIAVLSFDGSIIDGKNQKNILTGKACGDESYIRLIEELSSRKSVRAVILKVNSGGGSASASAAIANALARLNQKKPLVVVQSGIAGSGGYYISFPASRIFTHYSTFTGSIGVLYLLFYAKPFLEKQGITRSIIQDGEYADLMSPWHMRDEKENLIITEQIDHTYNLFTAGAAKSRDMKQSRIDQLGQGRIWSGYDAVQSGLCDEIGTLSDAVEYLTKRLKYKSVRLEFWPKPRKNLFSVLLGSKTGGRMQITEIINLKETIQNINQKPLCLMEEWMMYDYRL